ncbi:O-antigen ligase family protein [Ensifer soli]|uniref:O-antigen ligase family protein n=1 Tax=Ciceribacter sp. sgz301302 TaxID=3342379 RepID=UPI0035B7B404
MSQQGRIHPTVVRQRAPSTARLPVAVPCAIVLLALLLNGSNSPFAVGLVLLLAALAVVFGLVGGVPERTRRECLVSIGLLAGLSLLVLLQVAPVPDSLAAPAWRDLRAAGLSHAAGHVSVAPAGTLDAWQRLALPFLVFLAGLLASRGDADAARAFRRLTIGIGLLSVACLLQFVLFPERLLAGEKPAYRDNLTFVFVNRNTAATALGLLVLMLLVRVTQAWRRLDRAALSVALRDGGALPPTVRLLPLVATLALLLLTVTALALTQSRGGIAATAVAVCVMIGLLGRGRPGPGPGVLRIAAGLCLAMAALAVAAPRTILRAAEQGLDDPRVCMLGGLLRAARDHAWLGGGFGAFAAIFPPYRDPACGVDGVWDKAHNFYLEGVIGLGLPFLPVLLVGGGALAAAYRAGLRDRRTMAAYPAAGLAGLVLVAAHGLVDFSLQIPGMAAFYALFAALTVTIARGRAPTRAGRAEAGGTPEAARWRRTAPVVLACGLILPPAIVMGARGMAEAASHSELRATARRLDAGMAVDPAVLDRLADAAVPARSATCDGTILRAALTVFLAGLDVTGRERDHGAWASRVDRAERHVRHALSCAPADGLFWLRLAMLRQAGGERADEQAMLMAFARKAAPAERRPLTGRLVHWSRLSPATVARARAVALADLGDGLAFLPVSDLRVALEGRSPAVEALVRRLLPGMGALRRAILAQAFPDLAGKALEKSARVVPPP